MTRCRVISVAALVGSARC